MTIVSNSSQECAAAALDVDDAFDIVSLKTHLPLKRKGLSKHYSGKSRSFSSMADAKCIDDLTKPEIPEAKRKKYSDRKAMNMFFPPPTRRTLSSSVDCARCAGA